MSKRKQENDEESDDDRIIDVDFEFFDPAEIDFLATKRLLIQLFQTDAELLNITNIAELIINQALVGTTVKTDGKESDPYALLTVLNMNIHKDTPGISGLREYCLSKATAQPSLKSYLQHAFTNGQIAWLVSERLVNMPVQVVPPMYKMLVDEIQWALDDKEPYNFKDYLIITRTYKLTPEDEAKIDAEERERATKKAKKGAVPKIFNATGSGGVYSFHPEDECLQKYAKFSLDFDFTSSTSREADSFGLDVAARLMVIPSESMPQLVAELQSTYSVQQ